jgi:hypothetical protein
MGITALRIVGVSVFVDIISDYQMNRICQAAAVGLLRGVAILGEVIRYTSEEEVSFDIDGPLGTTLRAMVVPFTRRGWLTEGLGGFTHEVHTAAAC